MNSKGIKWPIQTGLYIFYRGQFVFTTQNRFEYESA